jgi:hypothetical protein
MSYGLLAAGFFAQPLLSRGRRAATLCALAASTGSIIKGRTLRINGVFIVFPFAQVVNCPSS